MIHEWPSIEPNIPERYNSMGEPEGWFHGDNRVHLLERFRKVGFPKIIVDGGSWMGQSAYWFLNNTEAQVICIDHWMGSREHQARMESLDLHQIFIKNLWRYQERIIMIRNNSLDGILELAKFGIVPNVIYIDWAHDSLSVCKDVDLAINLFGFPDSPCFICGDDYTWPGVREGLATVLKLHPEFKLNSSYCFWSLERTV